MVVIVTGAMGFIGKHLYMKLLKLGRNPIGTYRSIRDREVKAARVDIATKEGFSRLPRSIEAIFHFAAYKSSYHCKLVE